MLEYNKGELGGGGSKVCGHISIEWCVHLGILLVRVEISLNTNVSERLLISCVVISVWVEGPLVPGEVSTRY